MIFVLEAIEEIKKQYSTAVNEEEGQESSLGLVSVADGTAWSIGHLFGASLCQISPGPPFLAPWVYYYLIDGLETVLLYYKNLKISATSKFCTFYSQVRDQKLLEIWLKL